MTSVLKIEDRKRGEDRHSQGHVKMEAREQSHLPQEPWKDGSGGKDFPRAFGGTMGLGTP